MKRAAFKQKRVVPKAKLINSTDINTTYCSHFGFHKPVIVSLRIRRQNKSIIHLICQFFCVPIFVPYSVVLPFQILNREGTAYRRY